MPRNTASFREIIGFDDRRIMLFGVPLASVILTMILFNDRYEHCKWGELSICIPVSLLYSLIYWLCLRQAYLYLKVRFPDDPGKRLAWLFAVFVLLFLFVDLTIDHVLRWVLPPIHQKPSELLEFTSAFMLSALVVMTYEALSFYLQWQRAAAEKAELERRHVESQLEGLRNQVNPHFLFNSLNTLVYLIPENTEKAVRFVQQLSKVYRYVLESREARTIPLREEIDFLQSYIFLLKERFGENLHVHLQELENHSKSAIVPLTLQMLFENAIKHNVISREQPLTIEVFVDEDCLVVRNILQRKNQVMDSTGVGLENICTRYQMLTGREVIVMEDAGYFTVRLPLAFV